MIRVMRILDGAGLKYVRFPVGQLGVYVEHYNSDPNLAVPHTAAEVLVLCPVAEAVIDGPMFDVADGTGSYTKYRVGRIDYRLTDTEDGDNVDGGTKTDRKGCTLSVVGGHAMWTDGDSPVQGAGVAVQLYPSLVRAGKITASPSVNKSNVWRAGIGSIGDDIVFAVAQCSMVEFARRMLFLGCLEAGYTDGGGSARLAVREKGVPSAGSSENRRVPSWITCEPWRMAS